MRRVLGGLALGIVEVGGHGDDRAIHIVQKAVFGAETQGGQDLGADLDRRLLAVRSLQADHAGLVDEHVGQLFALGDVGQAPAHKALHRRDGVFGVAGLGGQCVMADLAFVAGQVTHHAGQNHPALVVGQAHGFTAAHRGDQRVGGAEVDADGMAALVRVGRLAGFGDLEERHGIL